jgi:uncharacterized protein YigE (DUF2233 family)
MASIVISYRRDDTSDIAGRIHDRLRACYGDDAVFRDIEAIPPAIDFRRYIRETMLRAKVLIAIIGPRWLGPSEDGQFRIAAADDPVRIEIETALQIGLHVIPILVNDAAMPKAENLPHSLGTFAFHNAFTVDRGSDFHHHMDRLIAHLNRIAFGPVTRLKHGMTTRKGLLLAASGAAALIALVWLGTSDAGRSAIRDLLPGGTGASHDVEVVAFKVPPDKPELDFLRAKIERNFVDLFASANLRVRSALTTNQTLGQRHSKLGGAIFESSANWIMIGAELRDANDRIVGSSQIEGARAELEDIYKVIPEALMYGMNVDPHTLKKYQAAKRPTSSIEAYAQFLEAVRHAQVRRFDAAERRLRRSIEIAPDFAMAYWAIGEIKRLNGDEAEAAKWYKEALSRNPDHPRVSIVPATESQPVPAILSASKETRPQQVIDGVTYKTVKLPAYEINVHVWGFDPAKFHIKTVQQSTSEGQNVDEFLRGPKDVFATNGGFFDIDSRSRLSPSGLLVVDRTTVRDVSPKGGSGVVYATDSTVGIVRRENFPREGVHSAVQCGPLLVDPGGKMGIRRNDFDRQNRTAVCLKSGSIAAIVVEGGLSLFELAEVLSASPDNGGIGCEVALNLDGGPSTQAIFRSERDRVTVAGRWRLQNALVVSRRD